MHGGSGILVGSLAALAHRLRHGPDGWGPYLVDAPTLSSRRLTAYLRPVTPGPGLALARVHGFLRWAARNLLGLTRRPVAMVVSVYALGGAIHEVLSTLVLRELEGYWAASVLETP
ncbi:MAG: hypothetical protein HY722_10630 [Planctomycetes bacterium]|nr:hypothetical protein [Planctomycetota bacterium]